MTNKSRSGSDGMPLLSAGQLGRNPWRFACIVGEYVKALLVLMFWLLVVAACAALGFGGLKGIWWFAKLVDTAIGS